jgi:hypothetical protein
MIDPVFEFDKNHDFGLISVNVKYDKKTMFSGHQWDVSGETKRGKFGGIKYTQGQQSLDAGGVASAKCLNWEAVKKQ